MSWFSTKSFTFELPGQWEERTIHMHRPKDDPRTAFALARTKREGDHVDLDAVIRELPVGPNLERQVVHNDRIDVGPLEGQDIGLITRTRESAEYYRIVCVAYYDKELSFQWAGPASRRAEVDARANRALETIQFRKQ